MWLRQPLLQEVLRDHLAGPGSVELDVAPRVDHTRRRFSLALDGGRAAIAGVRVEQRLGRLAAHHFVSDLICMLLVRIARSAVDAAA